MPLWLVWFLIGMGLLAVEALVAFTFYAGAVSLGAFPAAVVAALGASVEVSVAVFSVGAAFSLLVIRPLARQHLITPSKIRTGTDQLPGSRAVVLSAVDEDGGQVKIMGGGTWSARSDDPAIRFEVGANVIVKEVRGVSAIIATSEQADSGATESDAGT
ncbi:NfeD family protein [soil metagenome]